MIKSLEQGWAWDGTASPKDFCPSDMSPKAQNPGTVSAIFVQVPSVERESVPIPVPSPGIFVPGQKSHGIQVPLPIPGPEQNHLHSIRSFFKSWKNNFLLIIWTFFLSKAKKFEISQQAPVTTITTSDVGG